MPRKRRSTYSSGISFYEDKPAGRLAMIREIAIWAIYTMIAIFLAAVLVYFIGYRIWAEDDAMEDGIAMSQSVFVNRLAYRMSTPGQGDVVAFYPGGNENALPYIRRIVAVPGQTVQITEDGILLIDGVPDYRSNNYQVMREAGIAAKVITLENDEYFVLSDNRSNAEDSRSASIGIVDEEDVLGKVWLALPGAGRLHRVN